MNWKEAAAAYSTISEKDIESFSLSPEEMEEVLLLYNRAVTNAKEGGADMAMIALKKLLVRYPNWGEAALLYGISLAIEGEYSLAKSSFKHVQQLSFLSEEYTDLANFCLQEISMDMHRQRRAQKIKENENKGGISTILSKKKNETIFGEKNAHTNIPAQTPILTRAPKNAKRVRFATDRERRDVMMHANSMAGDIPDEEIELAMPKSPAEKLRFFVFIGVGIVAAIIVMVLIWFLVIPRFSTEKKPAEQEKLEYVLSALKNYERDPEISVVLQLYLEKYPEDVDLAVLQSALQRGDQTVFESSAGQTSEDPTAGSTSVSMRGSTTSGESTSETSASSGSMNMNAAGSTTTRSANTSPVTISGGGNTGGTTATATTGTTAAPEVNPGDTAGDGNLDSGEGDGNPVPNDAGVPENVDDNPAQGES